ncbi:DJ-1/PfpI family protein [Marinobacter bryozoorum]|jgi:4-methyl-5(b-hydroxyethyl)-thiazole monophosphate biosynthesis|uniref:DJ-1 family glyoxalase III n=1 Tax=Marinobacter bryozoorum TaxID=256324 RepID=UPI002005DAAF|nr:DJ-1 family glyoxalase III [Marinobacter bryozoorum]MCK7544865.1 DJ-1/PfpI family protein [Marinobacter bryozoorum]
MNKTALVPIADGSEEIESITIIDVLRRANVEVTVASVHEHKTITASRRTRITADALLQDCVHHDYDLIALPGGMPGAQNLSDCPLLIDRLRKQRDAGFWYAAICAAPAVALAPHGLLDGIAATGHAGFREALPDQSRVNERVVVDRNCITSQGPGSALEFALELVANLCGKEVRDQVAAPMMLP